MISALRWLLFTLLFFALYSCGTKEPETLFTLVENTGINFNNKVVDGSIENSFLFRNFYNGGGVAVGDINNDGLPDVFFTSNMGENELYLNKGNFNFENITASAGFRQDSMWSTGVEFVDINNDGWLDIYVCNSGHMKSGNRRNKLYINNHNLTFTEASKQYGLDISAYTTQVSFFDYDKDGDLDCFMIDNSPMPVNNLGYENRRNVPQDQWPVADFLKGGGDHLYRNDNGHFTEVTLQAGIHGSLVSFGLGVSVGDINGDGWPDVYVSNDSYERDYLYINQKNGTFKDEFEDYIAHTSFSSMGADIADINNDGNPEIFTTDMLPGDDFRLKTLGAFDNIDVFRKKLNQGLYYQYMKNCMQLNNGDGTFSEIGNYAGVSATDWSWGALMFDADNDGLNDIYVCNGVNRDVTNLDFMDFFANDVIQKMVLTGKKDNVDQVLKHIPRNPMVNKCFKNEGDLKFKDIGESWGFTKPSFSNGAAYADLDNDGDLDLIINNENQPAFIYRNNSRQLNHNHYVSFLLKCDAPNTFAIGSCIKLYADKQVFTRDVYPARGFQSSVDYKQVIGLGQIKKIDSVIIIWPDLSFNKFENLKTDSFYSIKQTNFTNKYNFNTPSTNSRPLFDSVKTNFEKHQEDDYVDYYYERNILEMLSREGPKAAVGDVNNDGLDDIYIGGTKGHPGQIYLQQPNGSFIKKPEPVFNQFQDFEDEAVLFFDADKDGDLDLFVGPGGNDNPPYSRQMQTRLFKNDGHGNFSLDADAFPANGMNTGIAIAEDFNHDGYLDLFVGGRSDPRNYGGTPTSFLYVNNGKGHFTDIAKTKNPDIANIGMVTGAVWADVTGDKNKELIITGEWMHPRIFSYQGDHFVEIKTNLDSLNGLWKTVAIADVNKDGKQDLILGNIGENFYLHPDEKDPVKIWLNDFNQNGNIDKIITRTVDNRDVPVFLKNDMQAEVPSIKKQNLQHAEYAKKSIQELFPADLLNKSTVKIFNYCSSIVAINKGNGKFEIQKLPIYTQLSSMNSICVKDINNDGYPDLVVGGNEDNFLPQFGRLDASYGDVLMNDGKGNFIRLDPKQTGLKIKGIVRDICEVKGADNTSYILFLRNNDFPMLCRQNNYLQNKLNQ
ncbi:MAG: VCBS repeat-containing protein [Bacteroidetes bacterium]|nr:VCBS repeat-containing protein [Bacteroidota bacterium]